MSSHIFRYLRRNLWAGGSSSGRGIQTALLLIFIGSNIMTRWKFTAQLRDRPAWSSGQLSWQPFSQRVALASLRPSAATNGQKAKRDWRETGFGTTAIVWQTADDKCSSSGGHIAATSRSTVEATALWWGKSLITGRVLLSIGCSRRRSSAAPQKVVKTEAILPQQGGQRGQKGPQLCETWCWG